MAEFKEISPNASSGDKLLNWVDNRFPASKLFKEHLSEYYAPKNFNFWYFFGSLALFVLVIQIVTGIFLVMHYKPDAAQAFASVEYIMRDVPWGWLIRYMHSTGASAFFVVVYFHMFRGLIYGSYRKPRELVWLFGCAIFLCLMAEAFMGYLLPWGQMSYWGAQVIVNLFAAVPVIGPDLALLIRGDYVVSDATLNRFFSLHYLLPFVIAGLVGVHIWAFHTTGNNNPTGVEVRRTSKAEVEADTVPFWPYYVIKDLFALAVIMTIFFAIVGFMPNYLGDPDNYIQANPLATPAHIVPEWYLLPFYAILRTFDNTVWVVQLVQFLTFGIVDSKLFGVIAMAGAILAMALAPWLDTSSVRSGRYRPMFKAWFAVLVIDFVVLMWCGSQVPSAFTGWVGLIASTYWFAYFLVILPLLGVLEKPLPIPATIEEDFNAHYPGAAE